MTVVTEMTSTNDLVSRSYEGCLEGIIFSTNLYLFLWLFHFVESQLLKSSVELGLFSETNPLDELSLE